MMSKPTVSVCMITYRHESYIAQAIESVLMQEADFTVQLVIGEDASPDATRAICEKYAMANPDRITLLPKEPNMGMMKNFIRTHSACTGEYIAFLEGDDYWTDPKKLARQVDLLRANPELTACFHNVNLKMERNGEDREWPLHMQLPKETFNTEDILGPWFIPSLSFLFVNFPDFDLPDWFQRCGYGDLPFMLLLSLRGDFGYLNDVMGVYRLHDAGMTTRDLGYDKVVVMIYIYESFNQHTGQRFRDRIRESVRYEIDRHIPGAGSKDEEDLRKGRGLRKLFTRLSSRS